MKIISLFTCLYLLYGCACTERKMSCDPGQSLNRIISLSPSITRQIIDLGCEEKLVGVTSSHPPLKSRKTIIGSWLQPNIEKIIMLKPDLILLSESDSAIQKNERVKGLGFCYHIFDTDNNFNNIQNNYIELARKLGKCEYGLHKIALYKETLRQIKANRNRTGQISVAVVVAAKPLVVVGRSSYINSIITAGGAVNVFSSLGKPYPLLSYENLIKNDPDCIILFSSVDEAFFRNKIRNAPITSVQQNTIFIMKSDNIAYSTPLDYTISVKQVDRLITKAERIIAK